MTWWQFLISLFVAITGWYVVHILAMDRDLRNKQKQERIRYLIDAYQRLAMLAHVGQVALAKDKAFLSAVNDIQLLGSPAQAAKLQKFVEEISHTQESSLLSLLEDLRADLRKELNLDPITGPIYSLHSGEQFRESPTEQRSS